VYFVTGGGPGLSTHVLATLGIRDAFQVANPELGMAAVGRLQVTTQRKAIEPAKRRGNINSIKGSIQDAFAEDDVRDKPEFGRNATMSNVEQFEKAVADGRGSDARCAGPRGSEQLLIQTPGGLNERSPAARRF
jgi:hypothetical protein